MNVNDTLKELCNALGIAVETIQTTLIPEVVVSQTIRQFFTLLVGLVLLAVGVAAVRKVCKIMQDKYADVDDYFVDTIISLVTGILGCILVVTSTRELINWIYAPTTTAIAYLLEKFVQ